MTIVIAASAPPALGDEIAAGQEVPFMTAIPEYRTKTTHPSASAGAPLKRAVVLAIFAGWTLFSVYVYSRYSQLGDAEAYLTGGYDEYSQSRTLLIARLAGGLRSVLGADVLVHLAFSLFAASGVCYLVAQGDIRGRYRWPLLAILLNPNFGVWASVTGRESLFVGLLAYFMGAVLGHYRRHGMLRVLIASLCVAGMIYIRAAFGIGIALFLLIYLLYAWGPRLRLSIGIQALFFVSLAALGLLLAWPYIDDYISNEILPLARSYFTVASATTRTWVDLQTTRDLLSGLWWILPLSLIGPTPAEVLARPVMLPFLAAGLVVFGVLCHSAYVALFKAPRGPSRGILVLGWLPATLVILVSYAPFGIYNPGSGIRYASCFLLFLAFPSLLLATAPTVANVRRSLRGSADADDAATASTAMST
ncbi:hypothetical protein M2650_09640 [Luteimonas sp. SX5]|uniref:Glycosyltransferase RgtA/B/C/D-like domain-containing protein n=1 Tax=Luteimonas galliterrae TaxID=2940486 RepID=A0ABT0MJ31_9GAMM|nr:hypothetical protein [Luteimonas galliterrae]MCL1634891.1 hypothetical protein [Luteimonas galliterrae]